MSLEPSSLADWTPEQIAQGKRWVQAWKEAGQVMEQLRRDELRRLDAHQAIALLCGPRTTEFHHAPQNRLRASSSNNAGS